MQPEILGLQSTSTTADRANPLSERATGVRTA
jgi:hypothetical protein